MCDLQFLIFQFLSTPSGWRATTELRVVGVYDVLISIHALRVEGDLVPRADRRRRGHFYPRPPGGGRLIESAGRIPLSSISIHALRVEGDLKRSPTTRKRRGFLSTPSGWRATISDHPSRDVVFEFLSTPSGWRATYLFRKLRLRKGHFYPRPPGGGRHRDQGSDPRDSEFLSTPSGWRATADSPFDCAISSYFYPRPPGGGRRRYSSGSCAIAHFYPRPPGGGRPTVCATFRRGPIFLSTPSGWRATRQSAAEKRWKPYFYPRPPGGGRRLC